MGLAGQFPLRVPVVSVSASLQHSRTAGLLTMAEGFKSKCSSKAGRSYILSML